MAVATARYSCGKPMLPCPIADVQEFLGLKETISPEVKARVDGMLNIKDKTKREIAEAIIDRWMLFDMGKDCAYVKHVRSERKNVLYQIVLSGREWDGIYEFVLKGKQVRPKGYLVDGRPVLVVQSNSNYNLATFGGGEEPHTVSRCDFESDEQFCEALLATGLVSKEELEIYYKPDEILKPYLNRNLVWAIFE